MFNVNEVFLMGNVTRNPEVRHTPKGLAVCEFGIAVNRPLASGSGGEKHEETTFVDISAWGKLAERVGEKVRTGSEVILKGRLHLDQWEDKQTRQKRSRLKVIAERISVLTTKGKESIPAAAPGTRPAPQPAIPVAPSPQEDSDGDGFEDLF